MIWTVIASALGIIGTLIAWYFNPANRKLSELKDINKQLEDAYAIRDKALASSDTDSLTAVSDVIAKLRVRKSEILQR